MRKTLLLSFMLASGAGAWAQQVAQPQPNVSNQTALYKKNAKATDLIGSQSQLQTQSKDGNTEQRSVTNTLVGTSTYSLQTNAAIATRITNNSDGTRSMTWTFSNTGGFADRGTGYVYYNGTSNSAAPTARIESERTGWPNIGVLGDNSEVNVCHTANYEVMFMKRPTKGTGAWTEDKVSLTSNAPYGNIWPRMAVGGSNAQSIHVISISYPVDPAATTTPVYYKGQSGALLYSRSQDGGATWDIQNYIHPSHDSTQYVGFDGDSYAIDASGNTVAYVCGTFSTDLFLMKSTDNGTTWTKTVIMQFPIPMYDDDFTDIPPADGIIDTVNHCDGAPAVLIDNNGMCHVWVGAMRVMDDDTTDGSMSYFPGTNGLLYWNEGMGSNPPVTITGAEDIDGNGSLDFPTGNPSGVFPFGVYQTSLSGQPHAGVDASNTIYLTYAAVIENTDINLKSVRNIYAMKSTDGGATWSTPLRLTDAASGDYEEQVYCSIARKVDAGCLHIIYQQDGFPGHGIGATNQDASDNAGVTNELYYACVTPDLVSSVQPVAVADINKVEVYPNPTTGLLNVEVGKINPALAQFRLVNTLGQEMFTQTVKVGEGMNNLVIDLSSFNKGVYLLMVNIDGVNHVHRVVLD